MKGVQRTPALDKPRNWTKTDNYRDTANPAKLGDKYGKLTVSETRGRDDYGRNLWLFACSCGKRFVTWGGQVSSGRVTSCGCDGTRPVKDYAFGRVTFDSCGKLASHVLHTTLIDCDWLEMRLQKGIKPLRQRDYYKCPSLRETYNKEQQALDSVTDLNSDAGIMRHWAEVADGTIAPLRRHIKVTYPRVFELATGSVRALPCE